MSTCLSRVVCPRRDAATVYTSWLVMSHPAESIFRIASRASGVTSSGDWKCVWMTNCFTPTAEAFSRNSFSTSTSWSSMRIGR